MQFVFRFARLIINKKFKKMKKLIILTILLIGNYFGFAQKPAVVITDKDGWHKIGETVVDFKTDKDEIIVIGADRFAYVKIKVTDAPINLVSFDIYFEDGTHQTVAIGEQINSPGATREIQIDGGERSIKKVSFVYNTVSTAKIKKARVELWGLKTNPDKKTPK